MSSKELPDLPDDLRHELPRRAQEIYQAAYNRVYETSMASGEDHDAQSTAAAARAHQAALLAVEMEYQKDEQSRWRRAPISEDMDKLPHEVTP